VTSVDQLVDAIKSYIEQETKTQTFLWTATVRQIMKRVARANETLATQNWLHSGAE